ncbi:Na+/H+ antiporter NhaC family protein [Arcobacter roscoffensis]|uniref:Na+/H+ antiporter NhaC family protein n=1 Tax=Arcobacter roscoffensis TaxID=2961520 RepID=A0ABY5E6X3_9BACT|nr:Na+/H+ antiporter NhaC family protein [Arcobacter roscoffensis]UTJ07921.1 Na+/H+ antiporter NhaC family protein [Arcobacter roscoffensis]
MILTSFFKTFILVAILPIALLADTKDNSVAFGAMTLLPPLVAILLAFVTRNVIFSLFMGIFTGTFMVNITGANIFATFFNALVDMSSKMVGSLADSWNAGIVLQVLTIGGMIAVITKMGGPRAIAIKLAARAKTPATAQLYTWVMGFFIFFDDYANSLVVGPIMRPVTDKLKVAREKLAFIIDSTAAPIAGLALISTWVGYELSLIKDAYVAIGQPEVNAFAVFVETLPYRFYNILMLAFVFFTAFTLRDFGPMYEASKRAYEKGELTNPKTDSTLMNQENSFMMPKEGVTYSIFNAIIPIAVLIVVSIVGFYVNGVSGLEGEALKIVEAAPYSFAAIREAFGAADASIVIFEAALLASLVAIGMGLQQKIFSLHEAIETWVYGVKALVITAVILILAWSLSSVMKELGTAQYLVTLLSDSTPQFILPTVIFILGSIISFSTGTSYGTMGILMPLTIPLANAVGIHTGLEGNELHSYIVLNVGAVLTGAIFGDHCSPISDTSILSSMASSCNHMDHIATQLPYALFVGSVAIICGYIPAAFGVPVYYLLPLGLLVVFLVIRFYGKPYITK